MMQLAMTPALQFSPPIDSEELQKGPVLVPYSTPTLAALRVMDLYEASCVGIVDKEGQIVGNLSASDFRGFDPEHLSFVFHPVPTFIKLVHQMEPKEKNVCCRPSDGFMDVIHQMIQRRVHRVWITLEDNTPMGVVTMSDILTALM